jgi:hypothetical protein
MGKPVILKKLISHDWATGEDVNIYDLADYKERWGYVHSSARICWQTLTVGLGLQHVPQG